MHPKRPFMVAGLMLALFSAGVLARELSPARAQRGKAPAATEDGIALHFSPDGGCEAAIVERINGAKKTIDLQAYSFTNITIAKAIAQAKDRGVKIRAVLDKSNQSARYTSATYLADHDIPVSIDAEHPIAHSKIMIIDGSTIITGSFNFTKQAEEKNAENLLILDGKKELAKAYERNFEAHLGHSKPYEASHDSLGLSRD